MNLRKSSLIIIMVIVFMRCIIILNRYHALKLLPDLVKVSLLLEEPQLLLSSLNIAYLEVSPIYFLAQDGLLHLHGVDLDLVTLLVHMSHMIFVMSFLPKGLST